MSAEPTIYTIGHSNQSVEAFVELLQKHRIDTVADVRTAPYSKHVTHFSKKPLQRPLEQAGIRYLFMGNQLGGKPEEDEYYDSDGHVRYDKLAARDTFRQGIAELIDQARTHRVAIMCAEEDPSRCHRRWLVSPVLVGAGAEVLHIRGDGTVVAERELRTAEPAAQQSLFADDTPWRSPTPVKRRE